MTISIKVNPKSSVNKITAYTDGVLHVKIQTPPIDGKANIELVKFLSKMFKIPKSSISIVRGQRAKIKVLEIPVTNEEFLDILSQKIDIAT